MFVTDLKTGFFDVVNHQRVLILVACDVDAICACKILQCLFQCENVQYTLLSVPKKKNLIQAFRNHGDQMKYVLMINCGATFDVVELLQPDDNVVFFIADSHRPLDVYNVYSEDQIRLLMKQDIEESIPAYEQIFRDESSDEEPDTEDGDRQQKLERALERRQQKRIWEENRHAVMFEYTQFSYYGLATSLTMFELAWKLSKDTNELLWWAIVGITEQYLHGKIEQNKYVLEAGTLQGHVSRHNQRGDDDGVSVSCTRLSFDKDLQLALYRHWSLFESLLHTKYTACKMKLWTLKGQKKLHEFLAELGLPLVQCKQKFSAMDLQLRNNVKTWIEDMAEKYGLNQIVYASFTAHYGFRRKYSATDVVYAVGALLESVEKDATTADKFLHALDSLSRCNTELLEKGIEHAKRQLMAIFKQVQTFLDMNHIISAGPFLYAILQEGMPDAKYFSQPHCLAMLANFSLSANAMVSRSRKARNLPLVLVAPDTSEDGMSLVIGVPPLTEESVKNFFGKAFEQAALKTNSTVLQDHLDTSIFQLKNDNRSKFFDALISLLS